MRHATRLCAPTWCINSVFMAVAACQSSVRQDCVADSLRDACANTFAGQSLYSCLIDTILNSQCFCDKTQTGGVAISRSGSESGISRDWSAWQCSRAQFVARVCRRPGCRPCVSLLKPMSCIAAFLSSLIRHNRDPNLRSLAEP